MPAWSAEELLRIEAGSLQEQLVSLTKQMKARTRVALAQGLLMGRYGLDSPEQAFTLLRQTSQRFNIKLHQIAAALTTTPGPAAPVGSGPWFPGRPALSPPALSGLKAGGLDPRNQGEVLGTAMTRVMEVAGAPWGNAQLAEAGVLRLEKSRGHSQEFVDYFAFVEDGTSCSRAAEAARQVTVRDITTTAVFDDETRQVILASGSRATHSLPLVGRDGVVRGVISTHHPDPLPNGLDQHRLAELERIQHLVGGWLQWHAETVVLDALEHLHRHAGLSAP
ncbi:ANTAR domain-containing protein [Streptomyces sp. NPDC049813]|uniref:ANTAR domain-containing protein n=1 Tax=Streptomyces sp. NPDC049813 TaxID=3365597 RepID=UPI0037A9C2D8